MENILRLPKVKKLDLPDVTLVCIDTLRPQSGANSIDICQHYCNFADVHFFTNVKEQLTSSETKVFPIEELQSLLDYNRCLTNKAWQDVNTTHMMLCQWDGFVINPHLFDVEWLKCDFIGGPCHHKYWKHQAQISGGFSIRSVNLMKTAFCCNPFKDFYHEDVMITEFLRKRLESLQYKFADNFQCWKFARNVVQQSEDFCFGFHDFRTKDWKGIAAWQRANQKIMIECETAM